MMSIACVNCGYFGSDVGWWPWNVSRGVSTPQCADVVLCAANWNQANWPEGNEPGGAVADALAQRSRVDVSTINAA